MTPAQPRSALVTGGTGFLGSHLVRRLVREGYTVHLLTRTQSDFWRLQDVLPQVQRHIGALEDPASLRTVVAAARPGWVFHLASATVVAGSAAAAEQLVTVNLGGTVNLLEACAGTDYTAFVTAGDSFEYAASHSPLNETSCPQPINLHGITKLASTLYAQSIAAAQHRPIVILRLFSTYGPYDHPRRLVPRAIAGALSGKPLTLSRPGIVRDWVYVDDMVDLFVQAAQCAGRLAGGVFNAGSGVAVDLGTIVDTILRLSESRVEPKWGVFPAPDHDDYPWVADTQRTFREFSWRPVTSLEDGLRSTIAWMQSRSTP
jgi:nucleoside-diphosphate-sugar epimerase